MAKASKQFKIGESAIGGIIVAIIVDNLVTIEARDWNTSKVVQEKSIGITDPNARQQVDEYLNELTSSYHAEKVMEYIESKTQLNSNPWPVG